MNKYYHVPGCGKYVRPLQAFDRSSWSRQQLFEQIRGASLAGKRVGIYCGLSDWSSNPGAAIEAILRACYSAGAEEVVLVTCHRGICHWEEKEQLAKDLGCKLLVDWVEAKMEKFPS